MTSPNPQEKVEETIRVEVELNASEAAALRGELHQAGFLQRRHLHRAYRKLATALKDPHS